MSFFQEDGVATARTDAGTDVITLTGAGSALDVKLIRLILNGSTATGGADVDYNLGVGLSDGTNEICSAGSSQDDVGTTATARTLREDAVIVVIDPATNAITDSGTISSIGNGTFTVNWTIKSATAYKYGWTAWGGSDLSEVEVGTFTSPGSVTTQNVATTVKSADAGFFITTGNTADTVADHFHISVGIADKDLNQGLSLGFSDEAVGTSISRRYQSTSTCIAHGTTSLEGEAALAAFDAVNGIQLNWTIDIAARVVGYALVKGGQWEVGSGTTHTSAATKAFTTSFQPVGLSVSTTSDTSEGSLRTQNRIGFGSTDGTSQFSFSSVDDHGVTTTETGVVHQDAYCLTSVLGAAGAGAPTAAGLAKFDSFNATDFTLSWVDDADSSARDFIWLVCAGAAAPGSGSGGTISAGAFNRRRRRVG